MYWIGIVIPHRTKNMVVKTSQNTIGVGKEGDITASISIGTTREKIDKFWSD